MQPRTLIEIMRRRRMASPDATAYLFLENGETPAKAITYRELDDAAQSVAVALGNVQANGQRVMILCPQDHTYVAAFLGCVYAGAIAVPLWAPTARSDFFKLQAILQDASPVAVLTSAAGMGKAKALMESLPDTQWLAVERCLTGNPDGGWTEPAVDPNDICYLQYTSGSTTAPKGVMITHKNVISNLEGIDEGFQHTANSVSVSWLPYFHDMGLVYGMLQPIYNGFLSVHMSPAAFAQRPMRWLEAISRYKATHSGGPNFAYDLCARKRSSLTQPLDLQSWRVAFNGAERVRQETIEFFAKTFADCGFVRTAFWPSYGLAEATLKVSSGQYQPSDGEEAAGPAAGKTVSCGSSAGHTTIRVVDPVSRTECEEGATGEIWVCGPGVARGYWNRPEETAAIFGAVLDGSPHDERHLRTGDLGYRNEHGLFITSRLKDLIIIRGQNYYPEDIEYSVGNCHPQLRRGSTASFAIEKEGEERLVVVQELHRHADAAHNEIFARIRTALAQSHGMAPYAVVLVQEGTIPKTTSGKIRRSGCRDQFLNGELKVIASEVSPDAAQQSAAGGETDWKAQLQSASDQEPVEILAAYLRSSVASLLNVAPDSLDPALALSALGIDSLRAAELKTRLESDLGIDIAISEFLDTAGIQELAGTAAARRSLASMPDGTANGRADHVSQYRSALSLEQQSLWHIQRLAPSVPLFNVARAFRLRGDFDVQRIKDALQILVDRHESLRSAFQDQNGQPVRQVVGKQAVDFEAVSASIWQAEGRQRWLAEEANRPFDLERGSLLRVRIAKLEDSQAILLFVAHHLVMDLWSWTVFLSEFAALYATGEASRLTPPVAEYTDFVAREADMLKGPRYEEHWTYWKNELGPEFERFQFPLDHRRPASDTSSGWAEHFQLDAELTESLRSFCRSHSVTLYTVLLAAFKVLLHRYTGQEQITVGSPLANRAKAQFRSIIGHFVNPVVVKTRVQHDPSFLAYLQQVRAAVLKALDHQEYPYLRLVERLHPQLDSLRSPLFHVSFALQTVPSGAEPDIPRFALGQGGWKGNFGCLQVESESIGEFATQFDLSLNLAEAQTEIFGSLEVNREVIEPATAAQLVSRYSQLLKAIVAAPESNVSKLPIVDEIEKQQWSSEWNRTEQPIEPGTVCSLIEAQAVRKPDAIAACCERQRLSYRELDERSNQLAHYLQSVGVSAEVKVGICLERSLDLIVAILATFKSGGAFVPVNPDSVSEQKPITWFPVVITTTEVQKRQPLAAAEVVNLDQQAAQIASQPTTAVERGPEPGDLAYVIYTSGSTGQPKGVLIEHRNLMNAIVGFREEFGFDEQDRMPCLASYGFDIFLFEMLTPLVSGGAVEMVRSGRVLEMEKLVEVVKQSTRVHGVPSLMRELLREMRKEGMWWERLRSVFTGGDVVGEELRAELLEVCGKSRVHVLYGPTEATIVCMSQELRRGQGQGQEQEGSEGRKGRGRNVIGRPLGNVRVRIVDGYGNVLPAGVAGEIWVGGAGVGRGYLNRREETGERFVEVEGERVYRTGDRGRYLEDGRIEFLGRMDEQVKVRGFRVELGEVESALREHEAVEEAVVVVREGRNGEKRLVAYVVAKENSLQKDEIEHWTAARVEPYMRPAAFILLPELPKDGKGRIDRRRLAMQPLPEFDCTSPHIAPRNPIEECIAACWIELLNKHNPSIFDNFFDSGGHSLLGTQLISRLSQLFGVSIAPSQIFRGTDTIERLAAHVETLLLETATAEDRDTVLTEISPLSDEQLEQMIAAERPISAGAQ